MADAVASDLKRRLLDRGLCWSGPIRHFEVTGSTSDDLKERARAGDPEWTIAIADRQTAGRGRHGHTWTSPAGNVYLSVLLRPAFRGPRLGLLPLAAGVAAAEALETFGLEARLKWPNDLLVGDRKVGGILAESGSGGPGPESVVIGFGINLSLASGGLPQDVLDRATSFEAETGRSVSPAEVAVEVLARLALWYDALAGSGDAQIVKEWHLRSVAWWGKPVEFRSGTQVIRGVARDVGPTGALILDVGGGTTVALVSGEARELHVAPEDGEP